MLGRPAHDGIIDRYRARRHGAGGWWRSILAGVLLVVGLGIGAAVAAPVKGTGKATASETKKPSISRARSRALRRARAAALKSALGQVAGPVDAKARKDVLGSAEAWTGAYRILSETNDGEQVQIEIEAEVDLVRLTKRVQARAKGAGKPAFVMGEVTVAPECGPVDTVTQKARTELSGSRAVSLEGKRPPLAVQLQCSVLGPVTHTHLQAATVVLTATAAGEPVVTHQVPAFGATPDEAVATAVGQALLGAAEQIVARGRGNLRVRVRSPMPSARIRRLEVAMRNSVLGVDAVGVSAIERGMVELLVRGKLDAKALARRLKDLSLPGFSVTVVDVDPPDVLTIRLD